MKLTEKSGMQSQHINNLQIVAEGFGDFLDNVVFIGGAVAELYATGPGSEEIRISEDIDCVIEIGSMKAYNQLERLLEKKGFQHDISGAPICRWLYKGILIDIMPTDENILGFSNRWYLAGITNKVMYTLPDGKTINIFPTEFFLASKLEAFLHRGGPDLRQSHDFEDIIYVLDNNPEIRTILKSCSDPVKDFLKSQFKILSARNDISEGIDSALPDSADSDSVEKILSIFRFE